MMLWALGLSFHHPITNEFINVTIPEPEIFSRVIEKLRTEIKPSYVYLLESSDKSSYVGATKDLTKRLRQHNREIKGGALVTGFKVYSGQKWSRVCHIAGFSSRTEALWFEFDKKGITTIKILKNKALEVRHMPNAPKIQWISYLNYKLMWLFMYVKIKKILLNFSSFKGILTIRMFCILLFSLSRCIM